MLKFNKTSAHQITRIQLETFVFVGDYNKNKLRNPVCVALSLFGTDLKRHIILEILTIGILPSVNEFHLAVSKHVMESPS